MKAKNDILNYIQSAQSLKLSEIAQKFSLSLPTIRRYVAEWETQGLIKRFHGSVQTLKENFQPLKLRMLHNAEEKRQLAQKASSLIKEGDTIFLGGGATIAYMCEYLVPFEQLTVITNSLFIINFLSHHKHLSIISIGGVLIYEDDVFTGNFTQIIYEKLHADKVFLGAEAVHYQAGISKNLRLEELNEHLMLQHGKQKIIVAESAKVNKILSLKIAPIEEVDILVTSSSLSKSEEMLFIQKNIQVV